MEEKIHHLNKLLSDCALCPRNCHVNRSRGEKGFCRLGPDIVISKALPHFGEEPPVSGERGAGTVFFSSCNLRCIHCQNWQISHYEESPGRSCSENRVMGRKTGIHELAKIFLQLRDKGCHNIEAVTPTPQIPGIVEALSIARLEGLDLPVVFNCGGYENTDIIKLLDGIVDIWLPDFKYGLESAAAELSGTADYPGRAIAAIRQMVSQAGPDLIVSGDIAERGIIIRHLVLPGMADNSIAALEIIKKEITPEVPISIMSQYTPILAMKSHPALSKRLSEGDYGRVLDAALELGFETIFAQEIDERHIAPDFARESPFQWL